MNASSGVAWALTAAVAATSSLRPALVSSHSVALTLLVSFYVLVFAQDERYTAKRPSSKRGGAEATTGHRLLCEMGHGMVAEAAAAAGAALHEGSGNAAWDAAEADLVYTPLDVALPLGRL